MGKVTVKHYLNTNLKPYVINGEKYYKIYVLIRAQTQNTKVKSLVSNNEYTESEFDKIISETSNDIYKAIKNEIKIIEFIVQRMMLENKVFSSSLYTQYSKHYNRPLSNIKALNVRDVANKYDFQKLFASPQYIISNIISEHLHVFNDLIAENYVLNDLMCVQWFTTNIKSKLEKLYYNYHQEKEINKPITTQKEEFKKITKEIENYTKMVFD